MGSGEIAVRPAIRLNLKYYNSKKEIDITSRQPPTPTPINTSTPTSTPTPTPTSTPTLAVSLSDEYSAYMGM